MASAARVGRIKDLIRVALVLPSSSAYRDVTSLVRFLFSSKESLLVHPRTIYFEALNQEQEGEFPLNEDYFQVANVFILSKCSETKLIQLYIQVYFCFGLQSGVF